MHCSFFEIYGGKVFDLLAKRAKRRVLEDGESQYEFRVVDRGDLKNHVVVTQMSLNIYNTYNAFFGSWDQVPINNSQSSNLHL